MNVIYAVNGLEAWTDVAKNLYERRDWAPVYWIAPPTLKQPVINEFPTTVFHTHYDAHRGILPNDCPIEQTKALDSLDLGDYNKYLNTVLRLMDRMEIRDNFHFDERVHHFYRQLAYWTTLLNYLDPNWVVFDSSPHVLAHYVLYAVCNESDVSMVFMTPTGLPGTILARGSLHEMPERVNSDYEEQSPPQDIPLDYKKYLKTIRDSSYEDAKPSYMETEPHSQIGYQIFLNLLKWPRYIYRAVTDRPNTYLKPPNGSVGDELTYPQYILYKKLAKRKRQSLEQEYNHISDSADLEENYIYIPLHYQPERTSIPEGGIYGDQYLMIDLLSDVIPPNWKLYIKEHPAQFNSSRAHQGRWLHSYERLQKIDGSQLIGFSNDSFELIDNSQAVATLTGTAGWEAIVRGTPALIFGNAWYRQSPGAYHIKSREDARSAVESIREQPMPSEQEIGGFVAAVHRAGQRGYLSPNASVADDICVETNIRGITQAIIDRI